MARVGANGAVGDRHLVALAGRVEDELQVDLLDRRLDVGVEAVPERQRVLASRQEFSSAERLGEPDETLGNRRSG
jgi:hypothetical protein